MNNITILFVSLKCKQKNKTLCYSTAKLLIFFIWQTTSANFLMKQLKNIQLNDGKKSIATSQVAAPMLIFVKKVIF